MRSFLCELKINGCKSINKQIDLKFSNSVVKPTFNPDKTNIKAIYGPNGAGKSAIVTAVSIYKKIINDDGGLYNELFKKLLFEEINNETNKLDLEFTFLLYDKENNHTINVIRHGLCIEKNDDEVFISHESISHLNGNSINDSKFKNDILVENGELKYIVKSSNKDSELIEKYSRNMLNTHSITSVLNKIIKEKDEDEEAETSLYDLMLIKIFSMSIIVEIENCDLHYDYFSNKLFVQKLQNNYSQIFERQISEEDILQFSEKNSDTVLKRNINKYEKKIKQIESFVKVFKPNLVSIDIEKKENGDLFYCDKIMNYGNTRVNLEFESTGIKKLIRIFVALYNCVNGNIVFIDEFDANLHDVYFTQMIEFLRIYAKGQLCFTTHNLEPIEILKKNSHSLDFLSNNSMLVSWKKDGNKSPLQSYINGLIPYSPFNVSPIDFVDSLLDIESNNEDK